MSHKIVYLFIYLFIAWFSIFVVFFRLHTIDTVDFLNSDCLLIYLVLFNIFKYFLIKHNESDNKDIEENCVWNGAIMFLYIFLSYCFSREIEKTAGKYCIMKYLHQQVSSAPQQTHSEVSVFQCNLSQVEMWRTHTDFALFSKREETSVSFLKRLKAQFVLSCLLCDNVVLTCSPQQCLYSWYLCCLSGAGWGPFLHWEPVWFSSGAWMDPLFTANNCSRQVAKAFQQGQHASLNLGRGLSL